MIELPPQEQIGAQVVQIYEDVCSRGKLVVTPATGSIVKLSNFPANVRRIVNYDRKARVTQSTFVMMKQPASTFIVVRHLNADGLGKTLVSCKVISNQISREEAVGAMSSYMNGVPVRRKFDWGSYLPLWKSDDPIKGVRRNVFHYSTGWIEMTTETYRVGAPPTQAH